MSVKYEIQTIKNSHGTGRERRFARIFEGEPMTAKELESSIQSSCSLTKGDVEAALSALREHIIHELSHGRRVHIPSIGYLSLSASLDMPDDVPTDKARADYIRVRNINFRPEASVLQEVSAGVHFERANFSTVSKKHTEEAMLEKIREFLAANGCINRRDMERLFRLRQNTALRWLKHFEEKGVLRKAGAKNSPVYLQGC